ETILLAALFEVDESFTFEYLLYQADSDYVFGKIVKHVQKIQSVSSSTRSPENNSILEMQLSYIFNDIQEIYLPVAEQIRVTNEYE
ncbi:16393_t:CDS:2, partial [Racocetra fulgida]